MDEDSGYLLIDDEELALQFEDDIVCQLADDHDTAPMVMLFEKAPPSEWPPEPDPELAIGTLNGGVEPVPAGPPVPRLAQIFAAVPRPTTSNDDTDY